MTQKLAAKTGVSGLAAALVLSFGLGIGKTVLAEQYTYDELGRLIEVNAGTGSSRKYRKYSLDKVGNRTEVKSGLGNAAPVANPDWVIFYKSQGYVWFFPLDNDTDADGDTLTVQSMTQPWYGTVHELFPGTGIWVYECPSYWWQCQNLTWDIFDYTVTDGHGGTSTTYVDIHAY